MTIAAFVVLMCYGGGFGTMPAFAADYFGPKNVGPIYGLMLTLGELPACLVPYSSPTCAKQPDRIVALHVIAGVMTISAVLPILVRPPRTRDGGTTETVSHRSHAPEQERDLEPYFGEELYDQSKAARYALFTGWDRHHGGVFAGHGK